MRVFLTGATGFIGSALIPELLKAGHQVLGLARSDAGARSLIDAGAEVHRGNLEDPATLRSGAAQSDAVIHCAFDHGAFGQDISKFVDSCEKDRRAIEALGEALSGSDRPLVITSGTGLGSRGPGQTATEDFFDVDYPFPRKASELAGIAVAERGGNVSVVRLPQVHDTRRQGLVSAMILIARAKGVSAYIGAGLNRWAAAHLSDVARLYRMALERAEPGAIYHAVDEQGVALREIAETVGCGLKVPVTSIEPGEAEGHFGWLALLLGHDLSASSAITRRKLDWTPAGPGLIRDLEKMNYAVA